MFVGRPRSRPLNEAAADYAKRIGRFCEFSQQELRDARQVVSKFPRAVLVALDPDGRQMTSGDLARWLGGHEERATRELVFVVGGAAGLPEPVRAAAELLSLSRLTLPHELARVLLLEQIYRAFTILRNHPYPR